MPSDQNKRRLGEVDYETQLTPLKIYVLAI